MSEELQADATAKTGLLTLPAVLAAAMIALFYWAVAEFGSRLGLLIGFSTYWMACGTISFVYLSNRELRSLLSSAMATDSLKGWETATYWCVVWIPAAGTLASVFIPHVSDATVGVIALAVLIALVNASLEEFFWRGLFVVRFPESLMAGFLYPATCFGLWHFAIYWSAGNPLHGGAATLVGGAFTMGLLWGWVTWRTHSLLPALLAHFAANTFAFTGYLLVL